MPASGPTRFGYFYYDLIIEMGTHRRNERVLTYLRKLVCRNRPTRLLWSVQHGVMTSDEVLYEIPPLG